ncbi:MAG: hypothetical protein KDD44_01305 [Bdellovibrionales bacterium]|nr:hypothetical protein [Bdellovibrionales bacterium]
MAAAMTPQQAILRRVERFAPGKSNPESSVYAVAQFPADHPVGRAHYDDLIVAVGAHWAKITTRTTGVRVELIFRIKPADFQAVLDAARALPARNLGICCLSIALDAARSKRAGTRASSGSPRRPASKVRRLPRRMKQAQ